MTPVSSETVHASCVAIDDRAVLITGPSGAGKSDLALRLIDRGAALVSDDYTLLIRKDGALIATAPSTIAGQIEVRGIGIVAMPHRENVAAVLIIELADAVERMPPEGARRRIAGVDLPVLRLVGSHASAPLKVEIALRQMAPPA